MNKPYTCRFLRVNLSTGKVSVQRFEEALYREFLGATSLGSKILYDELPDPKSVDALDPGNPLIFATGLLTGTGAPGCCLFGVSAKSPQTSGVGESEAAGHFGAELKFTGYDGIVFKGRSGRPVYLYIYNDEVELRDASNLWGKNTHETEDLIKEELRDSQFRVASIGQAGENLVSFACIVNDSIHVCGKSGMGAVMGSKNLKAVAVRGTKGTRIGEIEKFDELCEVWQEINFTSPSSGIIANYGTAGDITEGHNFYGLGDMPIKNWSQGTWAGIEKITGQHLIKTTTTIPDGCFGCHLSHRKHVVIEEGKYKGEYKANPEYELVASLGSLCLIDDVSAIVKAADLCDKYGMDGVACGNSIAFAMECYEKGLITKEDTDNVELKWGDAEALLTMIDKIAKREGFGDVLSLDVKRAAEKIGQGSETFAIHNKGMTIHMHDPRAGQMRGLVAVNTGEDDGIGAAGLEWGGTDPELGVLKRLDRFSPIGKAAIFIKGQAKWIFLDGIGCCIFPASRIPMAFMAEVVTVATGWRPPLTLEEIFKIGDRVINLRRCFNLKSGLTPADDTLPKRFLEESLPDGGAKGSVVNLKPMLEDYYDLRKWDKKTGKPAREVLEELGLKEIARDMWD